MNETLETIMGRRSIRRYTDEPVSHDVIETLIKAGMAAPSASNRQPWEFFVVTNRETLDQLAEVTPYVKMLLQAPVCLIVCGNSERFYDNTEAQGYWVQDCSAATENILVAAASLGLGTCWCGIFPRLDNVAKVAKLLDLPEGIMPLNLVALGHPSGETSIKEKWNPDRVHWDTW